MDRLDDQIAAELEAGHPVYQFLFPNNVVEDGNSNTGQPDADESLQDLRA